MKIPLNQWTHTGGKVLALKNLAKDGVAYGGFRWPLTVGSVVTAPETPWGDMSGDVRLGWKPDAECGAGLHVWFWGIGIGEGKEPDWNSAWLVVAADPSDCVMVENKLKGKVRACEIVFAGSYNDCMNYTIAGRIAYVSQAAGGSASQTGYMGSASQTGDRGSASQTGCRGSASQTGDRGSAVVNGEECTVESSSGGCLAIARTVFWKPHSESVLLVWWRDEKKKQHHKTFICRRGWAGKTIKIVDGKAEVMK